MCVKRIVKNILNKVIQNGKLKCDRKAMLG